MFGEDVGDADSREDKDEKAGVGTFSRTSGDGIDLGYTVDTPFCSSDALLGILFGEAAS